jgi:hypothetical protein
MRLKPSLLSRSFSIVGPFIFHLFMVKEWRINGGTMEDEWRKGLQIGFK